MKNQVAIVVAVALGLLAAVGVWSHMRRIETERVGETRPVTVIKARRDIEKDERLTLDKIEPEETSVEALQGGKAISWDEKEFYLNMQLKKKIMMGEWITNDVLGRPRRESMAAKLSASERAITVAVDQISGVAGYVSPGDHVDIYATFTVPAPSKTGERRSDLRTYLLLANVRVLQTGVKTALSRRRAFAAKSTAYTSVTLRVREQDAHILAFSQMQGQLTLTLRPPGDPTQPARMELDMSGLLELLGSRVGDGG